MGPPLSCGRHIMKSAKDPPKKKKFSLKDQLLKPGWRNLDFSDVKLNYLFL
jgi:hypothetical protein